MSRLIFKGDIVKNFGEFFPAPFVEKVTIETDSLTAELALHIIINEDREVTDVLTELGDLSFYLMAVTDEDKISNIISREANVFGVLNELITYEGYTEGIYETSEMSKAEVEAAATAAIATIGEYEQTTISEFDTAAEDLYDDNGNKILRLTKEVLFTDLASAGWDFFENISLFAFSSIINFSDSTSIEIDDKLEILPLLDNSISDIVFEPVFEGGYLAGQKEIKWFDPNGGIFDGIPLQSLHAGYFKPDKITHKEITDDFEGLLEEYEGLAETNTSIENAVNSISYILSVYGYEPDLIPRLNEFRKAFPSKSSATPLGKLYSRFKSKLFVSNKLVLQGEKLQKRVTSNPVVVDATEPSPGEWEVTAVDDDLSDSDFLYEKWYVSNQSIIKEGDTYANYVNGGGFFFFDLEKYIYNASNLSTIFNISKLESLFGVGVSNKGISVNEATLKRNSIDSDGLSVANASITMTATINVNPRTTGIAIEKEEGEAYTEISTEDGTEYSYLCLRNFGLANEEVDTYRLMCFEFQDLYPESMVSTFQEPLDHFYRATVTLEDTSHEIVESIIEHYYSYLSDIEDYMEIVSEECNYNNIDGRFNDFFIDNVIAAFEGDLENAPWIRGPIIYNFHRDLLFDTFGGDHNEIIEASKVMSDRISPYAGTFDRVEVFFKKFKDLYDTYYAIDSSTEIGEAIIQFKLSSANEKTYSVKFSDVPVVYDSTLADELAAEAAAYAEEQRSGRQETTMHTTVREFIQSISDWTDQYESLSSEVDDLLDEIGDKITSLDYSEATEIPLKLLEMYLIANVMAVEADGALAAVATGGTGLEEDLDIDTYSEYADDLVIAYAKLAKVEEGGWLEDALAEAGATEEEITAAYTKVIGASLITGAAATAAFWGATIAVSAAWAAAGFGVSSLTAVASGLVTAAGATATTVVGIVVSVILLVVAGIITLFALGKKDEAAETIVDLTEKIIKMTDASVAKSSGIASDAYTTYLDR